MNIIIPGVMRCGTTSLRKYLVAHPAIRPPKMREIEYFSTRYNRGSTWYQLQLAQGGLDKSPNYLANPDVPERIAGDLPDAKIVVLLRDPVKRAWSHYRWLRQHRHNTYNFDDVIREEQDFSSPQERGWYSILRRGHYAEQLTHWFQFIPREQVLVVRSEDLWSRPGPVYRDITQFLNLTPFTPKRFRRHGTVAFAADISKRDREFLVEYYKDHNAVLELLLGCKMGWQ